MYTYIYIYIMIVCMHVYIHTCIHTCIHTYIHIQTNIHIYSRKTSKQETTDILYMYLHIYVYILWYAVTECGRRRLLCNCGRWWRPHNPGGLKPSFLFPKQLFFPSFFSPWKACSDTTCSFIYSDIFTMYIYACIKASYTSSLRPHAVEA